MKALELIRKSIARIGQNWSVTLTPEPPTRPEIVSAIAELGVAYRIPISQAFYVVAIKHLEGLDRQDIQFAVDAHVHRSKFFPSIAEIVALAKESHARRRQIAAQIAEDEDIERFEASKRN